MVIHADYIDTCGVTFGTHQAHYVLIGVGQKDHPNLRGIPCTGPVFGQMTGAHNNCHDNFKWFQTYNKLLVTIKVNTLFTYW